MATLLEDMVAWLVAGGKVTGDGEDIFRNYVPDSPDAMISLLEYDGVPSDIKTTAALRFVQIEVRDVTSLNSRTKANDIYGYFNDTEELFDMTSSRWVVMTMLQTPIKLSEDEQGRVIYGFNVSILTNID